MQKKVVADNCRCCLRLGPDQSVARRQHVARGEIYPEKTSFNPLPGKAENIEAVLKTHEQFIPTNIPYVINSFRKI